MLPGLPVLALHVLDGVGYLGQAIFTWRILQQWLASERAQRSVIPASFWAWSLVGSCLLVVYTAYRREPVFMLSALVNGCIHARNLWLSRPGLPARQSLKPALWPVILGLVIFVGITIEAIGPDHGLVRFDYARPWLVIGFIGQISWSFRSVLQWYLSERRGESILPPSYFWIGIIGSVFSFAYAVHRRDYVQMLAYGLTPIPYARVLILEARHRGGRPRGTTTAAPLAPVGSEDPTLPPAPGGVAP